MSSSSASAGDSCSITAVRPLIDAAHEAASLDAFLDRALSLAVEQLGCDSARASYTDEDGSSRQVSARRGDAIRESESAPLVLDLPILALGHAVGTCSFAWQAGREEESKRIECATAWATALGAALGVRMTQARLVERIKELECLYEMASLAVGSDLSLHEVLSRVAHRLPSAWRYPEFTRARIVLDERALESPGFREGVARQTAELSIRNRTRGRVEIHYLRGWKPGTRGPFLPEEQHLLKSVASQLGGMIERRETEEERQRLEEQLRHADRLATLGQLAAGMAHEINEPLASIVGFTQLAAEHPGIPDAVGHDLRHSLGAALHAREIVRKLMWFARQVPPSIRAVNLNTVVQEAVSFVQRRCAHQGVEIVRDLATDLPEIEADPAQLRQVFLNLIVNAVQAMPQGGALSLRTAEEQDAVVFVVEDTGCGMTADVRERLFTPFFTTKEVGEGTGLGLAVSHGIVAAHGGSIHVESAPGSGSRFEVRFLRNRRPGKDVAP